MDFIDKDLDEAGSLIKNKNHNADLILVENEREKK